MKYLIFLFLFLSSCSNVQIQKLERPKPWDITIVEMKDPKDGERYYLIKPARNFDRNIVEIYRYMILLENELKRYQHE